MRRLINEEINKRGKKRAKDQATPKTTKKYIVNKLQRGEADNLSNQDPENSALVFYYLLNPH